MNPVDKLHKLQIRLGHRFQDPALLSLALRHRSMAGGNNERLEFLGDSVLNHIVAEALYHQFPRASEGQLSRLRARLVKGETLAEIGSELALGEVLVLGPGERKSGGHRRGSILADAVEALAGAILLDGGMQACRDCVRGWFAERLRSLTSDAADKDAKTRLQEWLQGRGKALPDYELLAVDGADHRQQFRVCCRLSDLDLSFEGQGSSRRRAEQRAAATALEALNG